ASTPEQPADLRLPAAPSQSRERAGVEEDADRRYPAVPHAIPLGGRRVRDGRRLQVVDDADVVAVDEHLLPVDADDDLAELPYRANVGVGVGERVDRSLEGEVVA